MSKRKPLDPLTKAKILIQGEYLVISLIFLVVGILKMCGVTSSDPNSIKARIFYFVTMAGSLWMFIDFFWSTFSKKRRAKVTYLDKILALPLGLYILPYDIMSVVKWNIEDVNWNKFGLGIFFCMVFIIYAFQAVYHWFVPTKALLDAVAQDEAAKKEEEERIIKEAEKAKEELENNKEDNKQA